MKERKGLKEAQHAAHSHPPSDPWGDFRLARGLPSRPSTAPHISASLEGSEPTLEQGESSPPRSRVADLPSSRQLISASLEATPRRKGQTALPLTRPSYGGIKCQPLLHSAQDRRRQAAIPHSGCDRSPVRQLRSLLRHPGRCGNTVGPATWEEARHSSCYYSANSGSPDSTSSHVRPRTRPLLGKGSGVATYPSRRGTQH